MDLILNITAQYCEAAARNELPPTATDDEVEAHAHEIWVRMQSFVREIQERLLRQDLGIKERRISFSDAIYPDDVLSRSKDLRYVQDNYAYAYYDGYVVGYRLSPRSHKIQRTTLLMANGDRIRILTD